MRARLSEAPPSPCAWEGAGPAKGRRGENPVAGHKPLALRGAALRNRLLRNPMAKRPGERQGPKWKPSGNPGRPHGDFGESPSCRARRLHSAAADSGSLGRFAAGVSPAPKLIRSVLMIWLLRGMRRAAAPASRSRRGGQTPLKRPAFAGAAGAGLAQKKFGRLCFFACAAPIFSPRLARH